MWITAGNLKRENEYQKRAAQDQAPNIWRCADIERDRKQIMPWTGYKMEITWHYMFCGARAAVLLVCPPSKKLQIFKKIAVLCDVTPCSLLDIYLRF